jgi:8-oxo-dGTP diphosphatase
VSGVHRRRYQGRTITHTWVGDAAVAPARVHALAFTAEGAMLLVGAAPEDGLWLPGGGIEPGESAADALARELLEETAATLVALRAIGSQRVDDPLSVSAFHAFYWARVALSDDYAPAHEVTERRLVRPDQFLATLSWGGTGMAALVLDRALAVERGFGGALPSRTDTIR